MDKQANQDSHLRHKHIIHHMSIYISAGEPDFPRSDIYAS